VRRVSATAIAQHEENQTLKSSNTSLQSQVDELSSEVAQLKRNVQLRWMLAGGALVLLGIALGIWFKSRTKRSSWN
jgi:SH3 domain protein